MQDTTKTLYDAYLYRCGHFLAQIVRKEKLLIVVLECTRQLEAGEVLDLTDDIQPNYDYFTDGPGYDALDS